MNDYKKILEDLTKAVERLEDSLSTPAETDREKAGCIQFFEFSFELAWKTIKAYAQTEGLEVSSPKSALKAAYQLSLLVDEEVWLQMLNSRNLMAHTYDESKSLQIYYSLNDFLQAMKSFVTKLSS